MAFSTGAPCIVSSKEQQIFETQGDDAHKWRELRGVIPQRNFVDVVHETPAEGEQELPELPDVPDKQTIIPPRVRFQMKMPNRQGYPALPPGDLPQVNDYTEDLRQHDDIETTSTRFSSTVSKTVNHVQRTSRAGRRGD